MTRSLCPICFKEIPAEVVIDGIVYMNKTCPEHGDFSATIEKNADFYKFCQAGESVIYDGHLVDVTTRCDLRCKFCYFEKGNEDYQVESILEECKANKPPYILAGGEPTLRSDLPAIIRQVQEIGPAYVLTNGYGLQDIRVLKRLASQLTDDGITRIGLSFHPEAPYFLMVIENIRQLGLKLETIFFVIEDIAQLPFIVEFAEENSDLSLMYRIKIASHIWSEDKQSPLFASDIVEWFANRGEVMLALNGKSTYLPFAQNGVTYAVVNWYTVENVDLNDINCPPTYRAKDGKVYDFVQAMIINQGMSEGWLRGEKL